MTSITALNLLYLISCETPVDTTLIETEEEIQRLLEIDAADSVTIDGYIEDFGLNEDEIVSLDHGVRYLIENPTGSTQEFKLNDLVSVHFNYKFSDGLMFQTTNFTTAILQDSLSWVARWSAEAGEGETPQSFQNSEIYVGSVPQDTIFTDGKATEEILSELSESKEPLDYTLYSEDRIYIPQVFNFTTDGTGLISNWPAGLRAALTDALPKMKLNSSVVVMCPSSQGFGEQGSGVVPSNTVVIFEVFVVNIRP